MTVGCKEENIVPILEMHLKADNELFKNPDINIQNKEDFILGSVFPDVMWLINKAETDKEIQSKKDELLFELHHAVMTSGNLRLPNYFEFLSKYKYVLGMSDFMKGVLFHLILDFENNKRWNKKVTRKEENSYVIYGDYGYSLSCKNLNELLKYKYGDMKRYLKDNRYSVSIPEKASEQAIKECSSVYGFEENTLPEMISEIHQFLNSDKASSGDVLPVFFYKHYDTILQSAIQEFKNIYMLHLWN